MFLGFSGSDKARLYTWIMQTVEGFQNSAGSGFIPLSAAVGRRLTWRCLANCNILNLNVLVIDELLVTLLLVGIPCRWLISIDLL